MNFQVELVGAERESSLGPSHWNKRVSCLLGIKDLAKVVKPLMELKFRNSLKFDFTIYN